MIPAGTMMNKAVPWNIKGVGFDARESAKEAARRAGMSLGDWLNAVIAEQAAENGVEPNEIDADLRLEAVAAKLARLNRDEAATAPRRAGRDTRTMASDTLDDAEQDPLAGRMTHKTNTKELPDAPSYQRPAAFAGDRAAPSRPGRPSAIMEEDTTQAHRHPYREAEPAIRNDLGRAMRKSRRQDSDDLGDSAPQEDYRAQPLFDPETLLNQAIDQFDKRTRDAQKKTASALANVAQWIETSESRREQERNELANVAQWIETSEHRREKERNELAKVTRKLDEIQYRVNNRDDGNDSLALDALGKVVRRLDTIEHKVTQRAGSEDAPMRKSLARLESQIEALAHRPAETRLFENSLRDIDGKIAALNQRLEKSLKEPVRPPAQSEVEAPRLRSAERFSQIAPKAPFDAAIADIIRRQRALDEAMAEPAAEQKHFNQRIEAIAAKLEQASQKVSTLPGAIAPGQHHSAIEVGHEVRGISARLNEERSSKTSDANLAQTQLARLRQEMAGLSTSLSDFAPRGAVEALENAMRGLNDKIEASRQAGPNEALQGPIDKMAADLRQALNEIDQRAPIEKLHREVQSLHGKLAHLGARPQDKQDISGLQAQMQEIRELIAQSASRPLPFETIERQIAALSERIDKNARQNASIGIVRSQQPDFSGIADNIRDVIDRALPRPALQHLEERLQSLDAKIDEAMSRAGPDAQMEELSRRMGDVQHALSLPQSSVHVDMRPFEEMMREISQKLETPRSTDHSAHALKALEGQVSTLAARMVEPQSGLSQEALAQFESLARSIHELQNRVTATPAPLQSAPDQTGLEETLRELARTLENMRKPEPSSDLLQSVEAQLGEVVDRLEHSTKGLWALSSNSDIQFETLSNRIDAVQNFVANQLNDLHETAAQMQTPPADFSNLENMMRGLATKIEAARGVAPSNEAIEHLEIQIERIAEQLEKSGTGHASIDALERTISGLVSQLEESRHATLDAAETVARTAARDTLREAMQASQALPSTEISREIADIRSAQDLNDRRTTSTLSMVHDTLERVVDRLSALEQEGVAPADAAKMATPTQKPEFRPEPVSAAIKAPMVANRIARPSTKSEAERIEPPASDPRLASPMALDDDDFLIEPTQVRLSSKDSAKARGKAEALAVPAEPAVGNGELQNIIAAARRLHQAQAEKPMTEAATPRSRVSSRATSPAGSFSGLKVFGKARSYVYGNKRALLLMVASVVLVFGTVQAIRVFNLAGSLPTKIGEAPADSKRVLAEPAETSATPGQKTAEPAADPRKGAALDLPGANAKAIDPTPVGTVAPVVTSLGGGAAKLEPGADSALMRLAATGNAAAQYDLAIKLGDSRNTSRDVVAAAAWMEKAAAQNLAPAQYRTGALYEKGIGVTRDLALAKAWYFRAAEKGNTRAMHNLAVLHANVAEGKPDYAEAAKWFSKAAEYGVRDSQFNLAILYAQGLGVEKSFGKSWLMFSLASDQGDTDAGAKKKEVAARLDNKQLAQATTDLAAFRVKASELAANEVVVPVEGWEAYAQKLPAKADAGRFVGGQVEAKPGSKVKPFGL